MKRERSENLMVSVGLAILLIGMSWGSALAQTKLMKPAKGFPIVISKPGSYFLGVTPLNGQTTTIGQVLAYAVAALPAGYSNSTVGGMAAGALRTQPGSASTS